MNDIQNINGKESQDYVYEYLKQLFPNLEIINNDKIGTSKTDIILNYYGNLIRIEVKSCQLNIKCGKRIVKGLFIITPNELLKNEVYAFKVKEQNLIKFVKTEILIMYLIKKTCISKIHHYSLSERQLNMNIKYYDNFMDLINKYYSVD